MSKVKTQEESAQTKAQKSPSADAQREPPQKAGGPAHAARQPEREEPARAAPLLRAPGEGAGAAGRARRMSAMQRTVGNARLNRLLARESAKSGDEKEAGNAPAGALHRGDAEKIQPLSVSHPDDASEREAEAVARSVVAGGKAPPITPLRAGGVQTLAQREGRKADEKQDDKPPPPPAPVQRTGQEEEQRPAAAAARVEAGRVAGLAQRREAGGDERGLNAGAAADAVARKGPGSPVDPSVRRALEPRMGADLSAARVHQDSDADAAARAINARAFTHGQDIFLARGESERDTRLMAHELTHVVQQRPSPGAGGGGARRAEVSRQEKTGEESKPAPPVQTQKAKGKGKAAAEVPTAPGFIDLKGMSEFAPPAAIDALLDEHEKAVVQMRYGTLAEGPVEVRKSKKGQYTVKRDKLPLTHPALRRDAEALAGLEPSLVVEVEGKKIEGFIALASGKKVPSSAQELAGHIDAAPELLGLVGFDLKKRPKITNKLEAGKLHLGLTGVEIVLGSAFEGTVSFEAIDTVITFSASAKLNIKGLEQATLDMKREASGAITGQVVVALQLTKEFSGAVTIIWNELGVSGIGKIGYKGEKMSGEVTLALMERGMAEQLEAAKKAPPEEAMAQEGGAPAPAAKAAAPKKGGKPKKIDYVVFGEGDLTFAFNDWLNGTAHVIVDPKGFVTIIGKITPQAEFQLFEPKEFVKPIFKIEARASYGIPVVGNIFIFANFGMDAFAKLEGKLYKITAEGTYSTDPEKAADFKISGSLNISAAAGLRLRGEVGAGLEILGHDLKVGAGINGIVGVKAYAEATPVIGYREQGAPGEDKKGEFFIRGDVEVAAQPFLGLSGDLFLEVDAPWWSPIDDDKWTWPLFGKEWPLGGSFGLLMSVDYVFGSGKWPAVEFKPAEFDGDKFTTDLYNDRAKPKSGDKGEQKGTWKEKNEAQIEPPAEPPPAAKKEKAKELPPAKPKVSPGGPKKTQKPVEPGAKTAEGKSVKQLQDEAVKKGKKPKGKDPKTGQEKEGAEGADPEKKAKNEQLTQALAALDQLAARYAESGAEKEEVVTGVKSVRRKFNKVFKSIQVIDGKDTWDYEYVVNPPDTRTGPPKSKADEDLKTAKREFKKQLFRRQELQDLLGVSKTTAVDRVNKWKEDGVLYENSSLTLDPETRYSFDPKKEGQRETSEGNRERYGYSNPPKTHPIGLEILSKGLRYDTPRPILKDDAAYHQTKARYKSMRPGSPYKNFGFDDAILGHAHDASSHWNEKGHKQTKEKNRAWNWDPDNYWGPEHKTESSASGAEAERYMEPTRAAKSHRSWWDV